MARRRSADLAVGVMFALGLLILAVGVMAVGEEGSIFADRVSYRVVFPNAVGLDIGSPVKISGVQVGTVEAIKLSTDPSQQGIEVEIGIVRDYSPRIRDDSRAALGILQLLSGEKFVKLTPGSPDQAFLPEGEEIKTQQDPEILEQAAVAAENLNDITVSLKNILLALERGDGMLGQMIHDPEFAKEGLRALRGTAENLEALTADMLEGRGFVGRLLYDEKFAGKLDDIGEAIEDLSTLIAGLDLESGAIGALLEDDGPGEQAIEDLRESAGSLRTVGECLASEDGLMSDLFCNADASNSLVADVQASMRNLAEITDKINRGEGTLGALINDRTLYDGMEDVIAGVNDSKFARWLLRHYQKKGIKADGTTADAGDEPPPADPVANESESGGEGS